MTTAAPANLIPGVSAPAGSTAGVWGDDGTWRLVYGPRHEVGALVVNAWACQQSDGSVTDRDVVVDEMTDGYQTERLNLSIAEARQLAQALIAAADIAEGWVTR